MTKSVAMVNAEPLVSICIPTYNSARYLRQSLDSVVAQTYRTVEVIIADNASTDETVAIAREYAKKYGFRVVESNTNLGPLNNWNRLVALAQGKYVAIYHSDDVYDSTIVAESVQVLERNQEVGLVGTLAQAIDATGKYLFAFELPAIVRQSKSNSFDFDEVLVAILSSGKNKIFLFTPSIMARRDVFLEAGWFDEEKYRSSGDYEMWLRIARRHRVAVIDRALMLNRIHPMQGSEKERQKRLELADIVPVIAEYGNYAHDKRVQRQCGYYVARGCLAVAVKQNQSGRFEASNFTAQKVRNGIYRLAAQFVIVVNGLKLRLPRWR